MRSAPGARRSVAIAFLVYGCALSTWVSRLPGIKHQLGLNAAQLGVALVGSPIGLLLAMQAAPRLVERWSSGVAARAASLSVCACLPLLAVAWDLASLLGALVLFGITLGVLDIAMNTQGVAVEREYGRPLMSGLHGLYSVGVLIGASCGSLAAHAGVSPFGHFLLAALTLTLVTTVGLQRLLPRAPAGTTPTERVEAPEADAGSSAAWFLLTMGLIAFCSFFVEGAVDDWSGVYLHEVQHASLSVAPLGAAACGAGMMIGRLIGDRVIARLGRRATLWRTSLLAAAGMSLAVLAPTLGVAIAGYAILGLGVATVVPIAFTLAGNASGVAPAVALSRVTTLGYVGLFGSPTVVGLVAQAASLDLALWIPVVLLVLVVPLSRMASDPRERLPHL